MKMIMLMYNEAIDDEVMEALGACCLTSFTKWRKVLGKGQASEPHLDDNVWPGANNVCVTVVEDKAVAQILIRVKELRKTLGKEGVKAFVLPVEEVV